MEAPTLRCGQWQRRSRRREQEWPAFPKMQGNNASLAAGCDMARLLSWALRERPAANRAVKLQRDTSPSPLSMRPAHSTVLGPSAPGLAFSQSLSENTMHHLQAPSTVEWGNQSIMSPFRKDFQVQGLDIDNPPPRSSSPSSTSPYQTRAGLAIIISSILAAFCTARPPDL